MRKRRTYIIREGIDQTLTQDPIDYIRSLSEEELREIMDAYVQEMWEEEGRGRGE